MSDQERSFAGRGIEPSASDMHAAVRINLYLSWLRSTAALQRALLTTFPTEESWVALLEDPTFLESVAQFQSVIQNVRTLANAGTTWDLDALALAGGTYYEAAFDAMQLTANRMGVDVNDLLIALVHAF